MEILLYFVASYLVYGIYLVWRDYNIHWTNAPEYVSNPNTHPLMIAYAVVRKPLLIIRRPYMVSGILRFVFMMILIGLILRFIFG